MDKFDGNGGAEGKVEARSGGKGKRRNWGWEGDEAEREGMREIEGRNSRGRRGGGRTRGPGGVHDVADKCAADNDAQAM